MSSIRMMEIVEGVRMCVTELARVEKGDNVMVLTDTSIDPLIGETFAVVSKEVGANPLILTMPAEMAEASEIGGEVPSHLVEAVTSGQINVVFSPTSYPMQHTPAIRPLVAHGHEGVKSRMKWINVPPPHFLSLSSDGSRKVTSELAFKITRKTLERMRKGKTFRMTTESGTDITTEQDLAKIGGSINYPLPAGRFQVFPSGVMNPGGYPHTTATGTIVLDAADHFFGILQTPIRYTIREGYVEKVEGGFEARWVWDEMQRVGKEKGMPWWEFSIGMNPCIPICRNNFEAFNAHWHAFVHRCAGAVHVAFGIDPYFHLHGVILEPTITCLETGETFVDKGWLKTLDDPEIKDEMKALNITPSRW